MKICTRTSGENAWNAPTNGASSESEMLGGADTRSVRETCERWLEAILSTASPSPAVCWACSRTAEPTSVRRILRVERSSRRTPSWSSRSATRRLTVEVGILRRRAASEKLLASTTFAKIISEFRSVIDILLRLPIAITRCHLPQHPLPQRLSQIWKNHLPFHPLFAPAR